jgi:hypothetical protein
MFVRRGPAVVLSFLLGAAALISAPGALASDGGAAKDDTPVREDCDGSNGVTVKLKVAPIEGNSYRLQVVGTVFSDDSDLWDWRFKHNGDVSGEGRARGREDIDRAFRVSRLMFNFDGVDDIVFRAENLQTGVVCRVANPY